MLPAHPTSTLIDAELTPEQAAHLECVCAHLRERIAAAGGWLPFAEFMNQALYAPGLGYYAAGATKLGAAGDFVTAPEISDLFSEVVALQLIEGLRLAEGGSTARRGAASVLELGPGSGRLAAVALREMQRLDALPDAFLLLEVSADLRERQRATIARIAGADALRRVRWLERLPEHLTGVIFANEVLDALPVERFVMRHGHAQRLGVVAAGGGFAWQPSAGTATDADPRFSLERDQVLTQALRQPLPEGYVGELGIGIAPLIRALGTALDCGVVMLVDYGLPRSPYYLPERVRGTLRCHFRHRAHDDPLLLPGLTDITSWVDFTRVAEAADDCGLAVAGFATQAAWLLAGGLEQRFAAVLQSGDVARVRRAHEARQLLLPGEMGEAVKVIALTRGVQAVPSGFRLQDLRDRL